jgi:hypothetical protein
MTIRPSNQVAHIGTYALPVLSGQATHIAGYALVELDLEAAAIEIVLWQGSGGHPMGFSHQDAG